MSIVKIPCKLFKTLLLEYNVVFLWYKMFLLFICCELKTLGKTAIPAIFAHALGSMGSKQYVVFQGANKKIKFAIKSNRDRLCLFHQNETTM